MSNVVLSAAVLDPVDSWLAGYAENTRKVYGLGLQRFLEAIGMTGDEALRLRGEDLGELETRSIHERLTAIESKVDLILSKMQTE